MLCVSNYFVTRKGVTQENVITVQIETQGLKNIQIGINSLISFKRKLLQSTVVLYIFFYFVGIYFVCYLS